MNRVVDVARMQSANRLWNSYPAFALVLGLGSTLLAVASGATDGSGSGLGGLLLVVVAGSHFVGMTQFFPFCAGLSVTRRDFLAGTALIAVVQALVLGLGLLALAGLEGATGGWGAGVSSFRSPSLAGENLAVQWIAGAALLLAYAACGMLAGAVMLRWGRLGMVVASVALGAVLGLGVSLASLAAGTDAPLAPVPAMGPAGLLALVLAPVVVAVVLGGLAHVVLRRSTP